MKKKLFLLALFTILGPLQALIFIYIYSQFYDSYSFWQCSVAVLYSLPQSLMVASWAMVLPFVVGFFYVMIRGGWHRLLMRHYVATVVTFITFVSIFDWVMFGFWGIRLDTTPFIYVFDDPVEAAKESPMWTYFVIFPSLVVLYCVVLRLMNLVYPQRRHGSINRMSTGREQKRELWGNGLLALLMCIIGNGCFGLMGIGSAYHSSHEPLNNAALHPLYTLCHAVRAQKIPLSERYRTMSDEEMAEALLELSTVNGQQSTAESMSTDFDDSSDSTVTQLLKTTTPNILLVLFESFSGTASHYLYPEANADIMPSVDQAMQEGVAFTRCYANSFRTERGIASVLASVPGQPTYSLMLNEERCRDLDYLTRPLAEMGYSLEFVHGGDGTYCGLPNFLASAGIDPERQIDRRHFSSKQYSCQWGLSDADLYAYLLDDLRQEARQQTDTLAEYPAQPYFKFVPTISSHEPFDAPCNRFDSPYLSSVAYADSCFGAFLDEVRSDTSIWNNLLIIGLADHCLANYPDSIQQHQPERYHIPMFWTGGVVAESREVNTICQQTDLAATLFAQLGIAPAGYEFSHDIFSTEAPHFAFYTWPDGYGFITDQERYFQCNDYPGHPLDGSDDPIGRAERLGRAYLQRLYQYIAQ